MSEPRIGARILSFLFAGLIPVSAINLACAQSSKPQPKPLTLEQKARLPLVVVAEVESFGIQSALRVAPDLNLKHLGREGPQRSYAVLRLVRSLRVPPERPAPQRLLISVNRTWIPALADIDSIDSSNTEALLKEEYLGRQYIFFGHRLGFLNGVSDPTTLQLINASFAKHEALSKLSEVQALIDKAP